MVNLKVALFAIIVGYVYGHSLDKRDLSDPDSGPSGSNKQRRREAPSETTNCDNSNLFISYQGKDNNGIKTFIPDDQGNYKLCSNIQQSGLVNGMITDRDSNSLYVLTGDSKLTVFARDSGTGTFTNMTATKFFTSFAIALDDSEKFVLASEYIFGNTVAYSINENSLDKATDTGIRDKLFRVIMIAFHPKKKDLLAIAYKEAKYVQFYEFDSETPSINKLDLKAKVPNTFALNCFVFSPDGKFMFAAGLSNEVIVFEIKFNSENVVTSANQFGETKSVVDDDSVGLNVIQIDPKGKYLFVSISDPPSITTLEIKNGKLSNTNFKMDLDAQVKRFIITPDGKQLIVTNSIDAKVFNIGDDGSLDNSNLISDTDGAELIYYSH